MTAVTVCRWDAVFGLPLGMPDGMYTQASHRNPPPCELNTTGPVRSRLGCFPIIYPGTSPQMAQDTDGTLGSLSPSKYAEWPGFLRTRKVFSNLYKQTGHICG